MVSFDPVGLAGLLSLCPFVRINILIKGDTRHSYSATHSDKFPTSHFEILVLDDVFFQVFTSELSPVIHVELSSGVPFPCLVFLRACSSVFDESK